MSYAGDTTSGFSKNCVAPPRPYHSLSPELFDKWLDERMQCAVGGRAFKLGQYFVARFRNGEDFLEAQSQFRREVAAHRKVGFLALFVHDESRCKSVEDELRLIGAAMQEAGLTDDAATAIDGGTISFPIDVVCPVTGKPTSYEFFSVAFCRHADNLADRLYDPSLSAPFTAVNSTSDSFGFAMLVHDQSMRFYGCPPYEIENRSDVERLFRRCVTAWQNMSITTIQRYSKVALDPSRGLRLSDDRMSWIAAHNDPVFAELKKCPHVHEMPLVYANRVCEKWLAAIFEGAEYTPARDGQAGGCPITGKGLADELHEL